MVDSVEASNVVWKMNRVVLFLVVVVELLDHPSALVVVKEAAMASKVRLLHLEVLVVGWVVAMAEEEARVPLVDLMALTV